MWVLPTGHQTAFPRHASVEVGRGFVTPTVKDHAGTNVDRGAAEPGASSVPRMKRRMGTGGEPGVDRYALILALETPERPWQWPGCRRADDAAASAAEGTAARAHHRAGRVTPDREDLGDDHRREMVAGPNRFEIRDRLDRRIGRLAPASSRALLVCPREQRTGDDSDGPTLEQDRGQDHPIHHGSNLYQDAVAGGQTEE